MKKIWGNTIVKNEERFIWFALMSVVDFLDKILVWDTGSSDNTVEIIKKIQELRPGKIEFREIGEVNEKTFTTARQKMLEQSKCDWIFLLDGDEVWWEKTFVTMLDIVNVKDLDLVVNPYHSIVGDIYHHQEERAGQYNLAERKGHLNIRLINRKIAGLHVDKPYGQEGYFDGNNKRIQDRDKNRIFFLNKPYMHFSNIQRSNHPKNDNRVMQRKGKIRFENGISFPEDFKYPEVFFLPKPRLVPSPWEEVTNKYQLRATLEMPFRKLKRFLV